MCNCKAEMEEVLAAKFTEVLPEGSGKVSAQLKGFAMLMGEEFQRVAKNQMQVEFSYREPGTPTSKPRTQRVMVTGNFCMFCGERYSQEHAPKVG